MNKIWLTIIFLLALFSSANATTYCVNALTGNDANSGIWSATTGGACWQTANHVSNMATNLVAGDIVAFAAGQHFRDTSQFVYVLQPGNGGGTVVGSSSNPVTFTKLGDGPNPVIDATTCLGMASGNCLGATANTGWAVNTGSIYKLADTHKPYAVYIDDETGWPTLKAATCLTGTCLSKQRTTGTIVPSGALTNWTTGTAYSSGDAVLNAQGQWYTAGSSATSGATRPTCLSGTCSDGTITWTWRGLSNGMVLAMTPGTQFWDGTQLNIWMPNSDTPNNHVIEASDHADAWLTAPTGPQNNYETINAIDFRGGCDGMFFYNNNTGGNYLGVVVQNSTITQTGTDMVDDGQFCSSVEVSANAYVTTGFKFLNNRFTYFGGHGGLTVISGNGDLIQGNEFAHGAHSGVDFVRDASTVTSLDSEVASGNVIHDFTNTIFQNAFANNPQGMYCETCTNSRFTNNVIWGIHDYQGCYLGSSCNGMQLFGGSNNTIDGNLMDDVLVGIYESNSAGTGLKILRNTTFVLPTGSGSTQSAGLYASDSLSGNLIDYNNWGTQNGSSTPIIYLSTPTSLATWRSNGFDAHGISTDLMNNNTPTQYWELKAFEARFR